MKTVIFGGSFNPPHLGHYQMLSVLQKREDVEKILLVPNKAPVHKVGFGFASCEKRLRMCELLAENFSKATVWDAEIKREEKSYTYLTLLEYQKVFGDTPWILCGADMLLTLKTWYKYEELIKLCGIFALFRKGEDPKAYEEALENLKNDGARVESIQADIMDVSSTHVRKAVSKGENLSEILLRSVEEYIKENSLYREKCEMTIEEYKAHIKGRLSDKRYHHSLCVAEEAVRLADRYGADKEKAYLAGLLHDTLKDTPNNEQLKLAEEFGIMLSDLEISAPKLYHSLIGCEYVKRVLGINDEEIYGAIKYHTTARANMTLLEKVIYLADYTSLDRDYNGVDMMREAVDKGMNLALKEALDFTVSDLSSRGLAVHPDTLAAWHQYSNQKDKI